MNHGQSFDEIVEVLESFTTPSSRSSSFTASRVVASRREVLNTRDYLLRFLEDVDGEMAVAELRMYLEEYDG